MFKSITNCDIYKNSEMKLSFYLYSILICLGIVNSIILGFILLILKHSNKRINLFLSLFLFFGSFSLNVGILLNSDLFHYFPHLCRIGLHCQLLLGPFLYLYIRGQLDSNFKYKPSLLMHFIPFAVYFLFWSDFYLNSGNFKINYMENLLKNNLSGFYAFSEIIWIIIVLSHIWVYIVLILFNLKDFTKNTNKTDNLSIKWIKYIISRFIILYIFITSVFFLYITVNIEYKFVSLLIPMAAAVYAYIIYRKGFMYKDIFLNRNIQIYNTTEQKKAENNNTDSG
jgi:hypothetical protein